MLKGDCLKKRMLFHLGTDINYYSTFTPMDYQPLIGDFYLQNENSIGNNVILDVYFNLEIDRFRAFFKYENLLSSLTGKVNYRGVYYPLYDGYLRIGMSWNMFD